jgi:hypothetical protein
MPDFVTSATIITNPCPKEDKVMLRNANKLQGFKIRTTDGEIGRVDQFYFDDETWAVRYLVVDTRKWWPGKKVVESPQCGSSG